MEQKMFLLSVLISTFAVNVCADVPLLAWTSESLNDTEECSTINRVSPLIVEELLKNYRQNGFKIIIFVEEFLAVEDFVSRTTYDNGSFNHLKDICARENCLFFPRVYGLSDSFKNMPLKYSIKEYNLSETIDVNQCTHELLTNISNEERNIFIIHMEKESSNTSRASLLNEHDEMMTKMCSCMGKYKVLCIYTGLNGLQVKQIVHKDTTITESYNERVDRIQRNKRYADPLSSRIQDLTIDDSDVTNLTHCEKNCFFSVSDKDSDVMIFVSDPPRIAYGKRTFNMKDFHSSMRQVNDSFINLKIRNDETSLRFNFSKFSSQTWELTGAAANIDSKIIPLISEMPVKARSGHSFACQRTDFIGRGAKLSLFGIQIEPFFPRRKRQTAGDGDTDTGAIRAGGGNDTIPGFNEPDTCLPFQSIVVFLTFIIISAVILMLTWAVGMLQDINSIVSFDGPQQRVLLQD